MTPNPNPGPELREWREFCPEPKHARCCQQPVHVGGPGFNVYRCKHCGSESYT